MEHDDESGLLDSPTEFLHAMASGEGKCYGQSILPIDSGDGFLCRCSCGRWLCRADHGRGSRPCPRPHRDVRRLSRR